MGLSFVHFRLRDLAVASAIAVVAACSASDGNVNFNDDSGSGGSAAHGGSGGGGGATGGVPNMDECAADGDCPDGEVCVDGDCAVGCSADKPCMPGFGCCD